STLSLLRQPDVTHVGAATDKVIRSFRNQLFDGYKTEEGMDPDILAQFPLAERALEALGVVVWKMEEFEADDALATAALRFSDDVERVVILTPDKDLAQCVVGDRVVMFDRRREIVIDEDGVWEKFGVGPESIPDYLGLVGDSADGFPGVPSWGAKSAAKLLARYVHLDRIPSDAGDWDVEVRGAERLAANLREHRREADLYRHLATLRRDVPLKESLADLEWQGVRRDGFLELCDEFGFADVRNRPHKWAE
ncbi:MAG: flap endonuclease, partial [Acidimicrobiia bacterium]|nr:flap endonuclease [Acidimicrobiia bacterium]